jgi:3-deoxy-manno-octulosonate cytidylyltransferase (CMP-KDO synthetase)
LENVLVATDDESINRYCLEHGMKVIMTSSECLTGTDRVYEVAKKIKREIYINVQGDEPLIDPGDILSILDKAREYRSNIINGMCQIEEKRDFRSPNVPKVVSTPNGKLLYMSRAPIPTGKSHEFNSEMRQVCIYAFPRKAILGFGRHRGKSKLEAIEDIEILRFLDMGYSVQMVQVKGAPVAVDTPEDLLRSET